MNRAQVAFGIVVLIIGVGTGYLMYTHPEGLDPDWPMWMAMLVPVVFTLGGLHVIASGLDQPRLSSVTLGAAVVVLWAVAHWAAFFTTRSQCVATLSFLGIPILGWQPGEVECRNSMRALVAGVDLVVIAASVFAWHRSRAPRRRP